MIVMRRLDRSYGLAGIVREGSSAAPVCESRVSRCAFRPLLRLYPFAFLSSDRSHVPESIPRRVLKWTRVAETS
jgi:hypothetical protein